jgi:hypothetical protein
VIYFAKGNIVAWVYVLCLGQGGPSCEVGVTTAQRQYQKVPA